MAKTIHVVSILDRSGSMSGTEAEVIGAYNNFIGEQKKIAMEQDVNIKASLFLFDNKYEEIYSKVPVDQTVSLDKKIYYVRGMTALYDAIGKTIASFDSKKNVIMFIETDGHENASTEYSASTVKELVKAKEKKGWEFNFVGSDLDSATTKSMSQNVGITNNMAFAKSADGYKTRNDHFTASTMAYAEKVTST